MTPFVTRRQTYALLTAAALLLASSTPAPAAPRPSRLPGERAPGQALERVDEMILWIEQQQLPRGGWHAEPQFGLDGGLRLDWYLDREVPPGDVIATAMFGVTLLRTRDRAGRTPYNGPLAEAIRFVQGVVDAAPSGTLGLGGALTPISARIGSYIETALALLLLAEAGEARTPTHAGRFGDQIEKLIRKLEDNQHEDGTWGDGAYNSPLLGHALAVWALESASRKGHKVDHEVVGRAARWALGEESEAVEQAATGIWKRHVGGGAEWARRAPGMDEPPVNHEMYASAARLSVLAQADRSNRALETGLSLAARTAGDPQRRAQAARSLLAIKKTRASLAEAQEAVLAVLLEDRGLSPLVFAAEDFLACLLLADSLPPASAERWFPTTVKRMVFGQDYDGGLRTDVHIDCTWNCRCERYLFKGAGTRQLTRAATGMKRGREEARRGAAGKGGEPSVDRQYCSDYRSYFSRERVFCTAVAVAAILADTPYKPAMFKNPPDAANKPK